MPSCLPSVALLIGPLLLSAAAHAEELDEKSAANAPRLEAAGEITIPDLAAPAFALSPDGKRLAAPLRTDGVGVWNLENGKREVETNSGHDWQIFGISFSPDGRKIATASSDKTAKLWDARSGKLLATLRGHEDRLERLSYSPGGKYILTTTGKTWPYEKYGPVEARLWDGGTGEFVTELKGHTGTITHLLFSADGARVFTGADEHTVRVWEAATGRELRAFDLETRVESLVLSPDEKTLLASSSGIRNPYLATATRLLPEPPPTPRAVVKLWDLATGEELLDLPHAPLERDPRPGEPPNIRAVFHKAGAQILTERRGEVICWDAKTGAKLATLRKPSLPVPRVVFSPDGEFFVVLKRDKPAELWSASERKQLGELEQTSLVKHTSPSGNEWFTLVTCSFAPDGKTFFACAKGRLRWWSVGGRN